MKVGFSAFPVSLYSRQISLEWADFAVSRTEEIGASAVEALADFVSTSDSNRDQRHNPRIIHRTIDNTLFGRPDSYQKLYEGADLLRSVYRAYILPCMVSSSYTYVCDLLPLLVMSKYQGIPGTLSPRYLLPTANLFADVRC